MKVEIEESLQRYTRDTIMGGVDNVDKHKKLELHSQKNKLYQQAVLGIFDFMIVNGRMAWNMLSKEGHDDKL